MMKVVYYGIVNYLDKNSNPLILRTNIKSSCLLTCKSKLSETINYLKDSIYGNLTFYKTIVD